MWAGICGFVLAFIYFYPLTVRLSYEEHRLEIHWLPRVWGGYGVPRRLPLRQTTGKDRPLPAAKDLLSTIQRRLNRASLHTLGRWLLGRINVERLYCRLQLGITAPFAGSMLLGAALASFCGVNAAMSALFKSFPPAPRLELSTGGAGCFNLHGECILSIRCGDIIRGIVYGIWVTEKGGKDYFQ